MRKWVPHPHAPVIPGERSETRDAEQDAGTARGAACLDFLGVPALATLGRNDNGLVGETVRTLGGVKKSGALH